MRKKLSIVVAMLVVGAVIGVGTAQAGFDTSYGEGGTVKVEPPLVAGGSQNPGAIALGPGGEAYVVSRQTHGCGGGQGCTQGDYVFRYSPGGQLDPTFGGPSGVEIPLEGYESPYLAVDSSGRPVLARVVSSESSENVVIRRLTKSGQADPSFGAAGAVSIPCACRYEGTRMMVGREGRVFIVVPRAQQAGGGSFPGLTLIALDSAGHRLPGFGKRGVSAMILPSTEEFTYAASAPSGALYFGGRTNGGSVHASWLARVSLKGKLDTKFMKNALKSLERIYIGGAFGHVNAAVTSNKGKIELFGSAGPSGGFELRLLPSGKLDKSFGKKGLKLLPYSIVSAIRGSEGATMALGGEELGPPRVLRVLGNGNLDKRFGAEGELLPSSAAKYGLVLEPGGKRAVTVVDHGYHECRFSCSSSPSLYRFFEGR